MQKMQILDDIINEVEIIEVNNNNDNVLLVSTVENSTIENAIFFSTVENSTIENAIFFQ